MSAMHPEPGLRVGDRYVLTDRIAGGGMGEVWRARDDVLGREVAVKLLRREYADDDTFLTRFRAEARHAASLSHPGIASVYDYGEVEGVAYLVMELVDGEPLSARIAREGALPAAVAVLLLQQSAAALQAAHDGGLVHRDVKPANLLLTSDDQVKVTDFGIARAGDQAPITRTGEVMGTAQYLSPEQAVGQGATPASDVYALGVVAYETLTGRRPFDAGSMVATAMAQVNDPPEPLPPNVPAPVAAVVMQALAKDPAHRPASAAAFGAALGAALAGQAPRGAVPPEATQAISVSEAALLAGAPAAGAMATPTAALPAVGPAADERHTAPVLPADPAGGRRSRAVLWVVLAVLVVVAGVALALNQLGSGDTAGTGTAPGSGTTVASRTGSTGQTSSPQTTRGQTSSPDTITLDPADYVGRDEKDVRKDLKDLDLKASSDKVASDRPQGEVLSLTPTTGLKPGDMVSLTVSDGKGADATATSTPTTRPSETPSESPTDGGDGGDADAATTKNPSATSTTQPKTSPSKTSTEAAAAATNGSGRP